MIFAYVSVTRLSIITKHFSLIELTDSRLVSVFLTSIFKIVEKLTKKWYVSKKVNKFV